MFLNLVETNSGKDCNVASPSMQNAMRSSLWAKRINDGMFIDDLLRWLQ